MTVTELIAELQKLPPSSTAYTTGADGHTRPVQVAHLGWVLASGHHLWDGQTKTPVGPNGSDYEAVLIS